MSNYRKIDWVICAAGSGTRFKNHGINIPKPLIKLKELTFLEISISCLDLYPGDQVIIIFNEKNKEISKLTEKIGKEYPWIQFQKIFLESFTSGQLATFYSSKNFLRDDASLVIWNCDTYFKSSPLSSLIRKDLYDAIVPCGRMKGDHWSFFKTDGHNNVIEVAEKKRISEWASVGFYFFHSSNYILEITEKLLKKQPERNLKEHYVSNLYSELIGDAKTIKNCEVDVFLPFGTPEEVSQFWGISINQLKIDNTYD